MRLGGYFGIGNIEDLKNACNKLDCYGLSCVWVKPEIAKWSDDYCIEFGECAKKLDTIAGETGFWQNMMTQDEELRSQRIECVRTMLKKADLASCHSVITLVGTRDSSDAPLAPHPYMFTKSCKAEFREIVLRILDGLDLKTTKYIIEPWCNTFFYQPEDICEFIESVDHPSFGLHLDQMNLVSHKYFYNTTELINLTFDLLSKYIVSVHLKDIKWDFRHMFLKWDEVYIGDGVMDYETYLKRLAQLPTDTPCFCEHMNEERDYALNFSRLHYLASKAGVLFMRRKT